MRERERAREREGERGRGCASALALERKKMDPLILSFVVSCHQFVEKMGSKKRKKKKKKKNATQITAGNTD